jgi:hypothetical protein
MGVGEEMRKSGMVRGEKRCEVWGLKGYKILMWIEVYFSCSGGGCYCQRLQKDRKDESNV